MKKTELVSCTIGDETIEFNMDVYPTTADMVRCVDMAINTRAELIEASNTTEDRVRVLDDIIIFATMLEVFTDYEVDGKTYDDIVPLYIPLSEKLFYSGLTANVYDAYCDFVKKTASDKFYEKLCDLVDGVKKDFLNEENATKIAELLNTLGTMNFASQMTDEAGVANGDNSGGII